MNNYPYLNDNKFLKLIDELPIKTHHLRLTVLSLQNKPIAEIQGVAMSGSITVNGASTVRRAGSLSMLATEDNYKITELENIIYMNKKVDIEVGYENITDTYTKYNIIWFPIGRFVMSGANISKSAQGYSISLTLKDQMSLLNGENGGTFETDIVHSPMNVEKIGVDGTLIFEEPVLFYDLIKTLVRDWGNIPEEDIIILDVPKKISNIVHWSGTSAIDLSPIPKENPITYVITKGSSYSVGDAVGLVETDYVYPTDSDLASSAGETITSVLDKIKTALGNYEYFFNVFGQFIFQKAKDYIDENESSAIGSLEDALKLRANSYLVDAKKATYYFDTPQIITSYSNAPVWQNVKNDFTVWGKSGEVALRYHLIIDDIPKPNLKGQKVYKYQDSFGVYRFSKSIEEAQQNIDYAVQRAQKLGKEAPALTAPEEFDLSLLELNEDSWRINLYFQSVLNNESYFYSKELVEEIPKLYNLNFDTTNKVTNISFLSGITNITATYWIDIITNSELNKFTVTNIGKRTKTFNNDKLNCLFQPVYPEVYFIEAGPEAATLRAKYKKAGTPFYQLQPDSYQNLCIGLLTNSAYENLRAQLHTLLSFNESVSLGTLPIYHLEPNTRILIEDEDTSIHGSYLLKSFTLPLDVGSNMTLQCIKVIERI